MLLSIRRLPSLVPDLFEIRHFVGQPQNHPEAVGEVRVTGEVLPRVVTTGRSDATRVGKLSERLGVGKVLDEKLPGLINVRVNLVCRDRLSREAHTDIATDLPDPNLFSLEAHGREPQSKVIALVNILADLLQRDILSASEYVKTARLRGSPAFSPPLSLVQHGSCSSASLNSAASSKSRISSSLYRAVRSTS